MNYMQQSLVDFHQKYGHVIQRVPKLPDTETLNLRVALIMEEANEFAIANANSDMVEMADALGDLLYVTYGAAVSLGIDLEPVFNEIHRSNMTKSMEKSAVGKTQKGIGYSPPDIDEVLREQGWEGE